MKRLALVAAACALLAGPALAGTPVVLKADTVCNGRVITLGDLFQGAGEAGRTPIAARNGASVLLNAAVVQAVARRAGLDWANAEGLKTIVVSGGTTPANGAPAGAAGPARGNVDVLTWARNIGAGEIVQPTDLVWSKAAAAPADAPSDADAVIGLSARRPLRAGAAVGAHDVATPIVVKAGDAVSVSFQAEGISLTMDAKAVTAGGVGETISVLNPNSKKIILAVVSGPDQAVVGPAADDLKSAHSLRFASR